MEWCTDFCLSCDQQTNGSAYCSQACRMADLDRVNPSASFESSSPLSSSSGSTSPMRTSFYLAPAIDFSIYRSSHANSSRTQGTAESSHRPAWQRTQTSPAASTGTSRSQLKPSPSGMSLSSVHSMISNTTRNSLSPQSKIDLSAYANAFDEVRLLKRRRSLY